MGKAKLDVIISQDLVPYTEAMQFMQSKIACIIAGKCNQAIWLLEHPHIYTGGRMAKKKDILKDVGVPYYKTDRGGQVTFHGPGQKIVYLMLDLKSIFQDGLDIRCFIKMLGEWLCLVLQEFNIRAVINNENIGLWVDKDNIQSKIASIGLKVKKTFLYHGIALNVNPDLSYFQNIVPCGIKSASITSIEKFAVIDPKRLNDVNYFLIKHFLDIFNYKIIGRHTS